MPDINLRYELNLENKIYETNVSENEYIYTLSIYMAVFLNETHNFTSVFDNRSSFCLPVIKTSTVEAARIFKKLIVEQYTKCGFSYLKDSYPIDLRAFKAVRALTPLLHATTTLLVVLAGFGNPYLSSNSLSSLANASLISGTSMK